jgi:hypothetical protein
VGRELVLLIRATVSEQQGPPVYPADGLRAVYGKPACGLQVTGELLNPGTRSLRFKTS